MQKLVIKEPFMGVQPCEIEFDRFLLLIGEQASGKSTIAKLIYFFQSVPDVIYKSVVIGKKRGEIYNEENHVFNSIGNDFTSTFGAIRNLNYSFEIEFFFGQNFSLSIKKEDKDSNQIILESIEEDELLTKAIKDYFEPKKNVLRNSDKNELSLRQNLIHDFNKIFNRSTTINNYLIAGRNNVVAYSDYFESKVKTESEKLLEDEVRGLDLQKKIMSGNEKLLLEFVNWSSDIRKYFQNNGGSFKSAKPDLENQSALSIFETIFSKILKAEYSHNSNGEFLKINDNESVYMKDASSGQQEVLRILQGLYLSVGLKNRREFFVVEEPEAHLYPLAQKELINAFSLFLNTIKEGRLIITTHSPYILACVNILLFANYVANEIPESENEVLASVPKDFWLDSKMFNAYSLGHEGEYCKNIKDSETGLIDQNYLDLISEQLGLQYNNLYNLLVESHV
jgi:predicted ATPase